MFAKFSSSIVGVVVSVVVIGGGGNGVVCLFVSQRFCNGPERICVCLCVCVCVCTLFFYRIVFTWMFFP